MTSPNNASQKEKHFGEILRMLSHNHVAKIRVMYSKRKMSEDAEQNQLNWSVKVIAVNSMYETCQTILTCYFEAY